MKIESNKNWTTCLRLNTGDGSPRVFLLNSHFLGSVPTHTVGLFFYLRLSPVQRYRYYNSIREILRNHGLRVFERILVSC